MASRPKSPPIIRVPGLKPSASRRTPYDRPPLFYCKVCEMKYTDEREYRTHCKSLLHRTSVMLNQTIQTPSFRCAQCNVVCKGVDSFDLHLASEEHIEFKYNEKTRGDRHEAPAKRTEQIEQKRTVSENELLTYLIDDDEESWATSRPEKNRTSEQPSPEENGTIEGLKMRSIATNACDEAKGLLDEILRSYENSESIKPDSLPNALESNGLESDSDVEILEEHESVPEKQPESKVTRWTEPSPSPLKSPPKSLPAASEPAKNEEQTFFCTVCNVHCNGLPQIFTHLNGKKHLSLLLQQRNPKRNSQNLVQLVDREPVVTSVIRTRAVESDSYSSYYYPDDAPLLGLEYTQKEITPVKTLYNCSLCRCRMIGYRALEQHLRGKRHLQTWEYYKGPNSSYVEPTRTQSWQQNRKHWKSSQYWQSWQSWQSW